ncbi:MAG: hypothetical protein DRN14_05035 [Thermoplasmata archaeon]|nr:MAG: hypothetical protein DRN14_05035 [Thermoplasmata archaeon]
MALNHYITWQLNRVLSVASNQKCQDMSDGVTKLLRHYFVGFSFDECGDFDLVGYPYTGFYGNLCSYHRLKPPYRVVDALFDATSCETYRANCGLISGKAEWRRVRLTPFKYITEMPPHYVPFFRHDDIHTNYPYYTLFYKAEKSFASDLFKYIHKTIAAGRKADCIKTSRGPRGAASGYLKSYSGTRVRIRQLRKAINALLKQPDPFVFEVHGFTLGEVELKVKKALNILKGKYSSSREKRAPYIVTPTLPYQGGCCAFIFSAGKEMLNRLSNYFVKFIKRLRPGVHMSSVVITPSRSRIACDFYYIKRVTQPVIFSVLDFIGRCNPGLMRRKWFTCSKDLLNRIKRRKVNLLHHRIRSYCAWGMWLAIPRRLIEKGCLPTISGMPRFRNGVVEQVGCAFRAKHVTDKYVYYFRWSDKKLTVKHSPYAVFKNPDFNDIPLHIDMFKRARITQNPIFTFVAYGLIGCLPLTKNARRDLYYDFKPRFTYSDFVDKPETYFDYLLSCAYYGIVPAPPPPILELRHVYARLYVGYVLTCVHLKVLPLYTKFIEAVSVPPELRETVEVIKECLSSS